MRQVRHRAGPAFESIEVDGTMALAEVAGILNAVASCPRLDPADRILIRRRGPGQVEVRTAEARAAIGPARPPSGCTLQLSGGGSRGWAVESHGYWIA